MSVNKPVIMYPSDKLLEQPYHSSDYRSQRPQSTTGIDNTILNVGHNYMSQGKLSITGILLSFLF